MESTIHYTGDSHLYVQYISSEILHYLWNTKNIFRTNYITVKFINCTNCSTHLLFIKYFAAKKLTKISSWYSIFMGRSMCCIVVEEAMARSLMFFNLNIIWLHVHICALIKITWPRHSWHWFCDAFLCVNVFDKNVFQIEP